MSGRRSRGCVDRQCGSADVMGRSERGGAQEFGGSGIGSRGGSCLD